jgi:hypothetical protein
MSRLSREDAAKSVIAVWRWLSERPDAPKIEGNISELLSQLGNVGNVSHENGTALDERLKLLAFLGLVRRESRHEYQRGENGERTFPRYVGTTILLERDVEKGARIIAQHFARGGFLKVKSLGNQRLNGVKQRQAAAQGRSREGRDSHRRAGTPCRGGRWRGCPDHWRRDPSAVRDRRLVQAGR